MRSRRFSIIYNSRVVFFFKKTGLGGLNQIQGVQSWGLVKNQVVVYASKNTVLALILDR